MRRQPEFCKFNWGGEEKKERGRYKTMEILPLYSVLRQKERGGVDDHPPAFR